MFNLSDPKLSDLIIYDYHFTIAQKEMMKYLTNDEKQRLTTIIINHFNRKQQKYRLKQELFDNFAGKIDNYLFTDLCYAKDIDTEKEIMYDYYSGFDTLESKDELNELINNEYLNLYPDLKQEVIQNLISLIGLD